MHADEKRRQTGIEADKELTCREMELKEQAQANTSVTADPPPCYRDTKLPPELPILPDEKDELDSHLIHFECYANNASSEKHVGY